MAYRANDFSSTQTPEQRADEARLILFSYAKGMDLLKHVGSMTTEEQGFVNRVAERLQLADGMNARTGVSIKELWWLRDLKDKYLP